MAYFAIEAATTDGLHSYTARDSMDAEFCQKWLLRWKMKTKGEKYVCISGSYAGLSDFRNGILVTDWVFEKFKSARGCESFF